MKREPWAPKPDRARGGGARVSRGAIGAQGRRAALADRELRFADLRGHTDDIEAHGDRAAADLAPEPA